MRIVTVSARGQIVIPAEVRKALALKQGDQLECLVSEGKLVLVPLGEKPFLRLYGAFRGDSSLVRALEEDHAREIEKGR